MRKIALVTGANGWLGKNFCSALLSPKLLEHRDLESLHFDEIRALVLPEEDCKHLESLSPKVKIYRGNLENLSSLKSFFEVKDSTFFFHLAGVIHPNKMVDFEKVNVQGTLACLESLDTEKVEKAVVLSSNSPMGCNPFREHEFTEESPYNPYMGYGRSKKDMEIKSKKLAMQKGLDLTLIRAPWFYGPHQPERQSSFFKMIQKGVFPQLGDGKNRRSMCYVDNLSQGLLLASLKKNGPGNSNTYWIADETPYEMKTIIETTREVIADKLGKEKVRKGKVFLPWVLGEVFTFVDYILQKIGLYNQKVHVLSELNKNISCSIDKAKDELGYSPKISLKEGMRRSLSWCLENRGGL